LAVGDAAVAFYPLSGQGLDRGLRSAFRAAEAISAALHGSGDLLMAYQMMQQRSLADYLRKRADYYQREKRWLRSPFWQRRLESNDYFFKGAS
jgi:2-polyprenyl-6-methoxyphenol hydroxylase-like FAD-dependent oxidoreductase